jgi:PAS domain S-box-containing protein
VTATARPAGLAAPERRSPDVARVPSEAHTERRANAAFRGFFQNLGVGGVQIDRDGRFIQANEHFARLTGYSHDELLTMRVGALDHPDDRADDQQRWAAFLADPAVGYDTEKRYVRRDGSVIWVHVTAAPIQTGPDEVTIAKTVEDITDKVLAIQALRERELRLREALAVKEEFLGMVSHELRTPLTVILGMANVLARSGSTPKQVERTILEIRESAEQLASLLESMLVLARVGEEDPDLEPLLLDRVVRRAVDRHREVFPKRRIGVSVRAAAPLVEANEAWIYQVIANMLGNAEKYSPQHGRITVIVDRDPTEVSVRVLDQGHGIADEDAPHIFDAFYRAAHAVKESAGLGLGLAVCKRLVELQGGMVWAATRREGGAEFGFALPVLEADE